MEASYTKVKDIESFKNWLNHLPKKFSLDFRTKLFKVIKKGQSVLWTRKDDIKFI